MENVFSVLIFELVSEKVIYYLLKGNYSHLEDVFINVAGGDKQKQRELNNIIYDTEGNEKNESFKKFPIDKVKELIKNDINVIFVSCGFYL